jgi:hypothetical protein
VLTEPIGADSVTGEPPLLMWVPALAVMLPVVATAEMLPPAGTDNEPPSVMLVPAVMPMLWLELSAEPLPSTMSVLADRPMSAPVRCCRSAPGCAP